MIRKTEGQTHVHVGPVGRRDRTAEAGAGDVGIQPLSTALVPCNVVYMGRGAKETVLKSC